jgi:hypothetical protein
MLQNEITKCLQHMDGEHRKMSTSRVMMFASYLLFICLISTLAQTSSASLSNSYSTISSSGTVLYSTNIRKYINAYGFRGFSNGTADFISSHFDWIDTDYAVQNIVGFRRMKSNNPSLIITVYKNVMGVSSSDPDWNIISQHEDWFVHDKNGNRVLNKWWSWYLMDVGNTGWRNFYTNWCTTVLQEQSINGIFADDVWNTVPSGDFPDTWWNPWTVPNSYINGTIGEQWHSNMLAFIQYVKQSIGNKLFIINSAEIQDYMNACDGREEEGFVHRHDWSYTEFDSINWKEAVDGVMQDGKIGKHVMVKSGFSELDESPPPSKEIVDTMLMYGFSSYLLALNGDKMFFGFGSCWSTDGSQGYYPVFDAAKALGHPVNNYYSYQSVYARDFQNGKVLVNPSDSTYTVSLNQNYKTLDGHVVTGVTLNGHTGAILLEN